MLQNLAWDSSFFGFGVANITTPIENTNQFNELYFQMKEDNVSLCYYACESELQSNFFENELLEVIKVDEKISFRKGISVLENPSQHLVNIANLDSRINEFESLAIQSGEFSRFKVDPRIANNKFENLYKIWIRNSLLRKNAREVFCICYENKVAALITIGEKYKKPLIGLVAVDKAFRGKGFGKALIQAVEKWCYDNKYENLDVVTQGNNIPAIRLYESCGFDLFEKKNIYHIWRNE